MTHFRSYLLINIATIKCIDSITSPIPKYKIPKVKTPTKVCRYLLCVVMWKVEIVRLKIIKQGRWGRVVKTSVKMTMCRDIKLCYVMLCVCHTSYDLALGAIYIPFHCPQKYGAGTYLFVRNFMINARLLFSASLAATWMWIETQTLPLNCNNSWALTRVFWIRQAFVKIPKIIWQQMQYLLHV